MMTMMTLLAIYMLYSYSYVYYVYFIIYSQFYLNIYCLFGFAANFDCVRSQHLVVRPVRGLLTSCIIIWWAFRYWYTIVLIYADTPHTHTHACIAYMRRHRTHAADIIYYILYSMEYNGNSKSYFFRAVPPRCALCVRARIHEMSTRYMWLCGACAHELNWIRKSTSTSVAIAHVHYFMNQVPSADEEAYAHTVRAQPFPCDPSSPILTICAYMCMHACIA